MSTTAKYLRLCILLLPNLARVNLHIFNSQPFRSAPLRNIIGPHKLLLFILFCLSGLLPNLARTIQNYFGRIARVCCYVTITGQLVTSYIPKTNIIGKYVTQVKPVYIYDAIQKASLNIQTLSKTAT